jgi:hypothetical protein
MNRLESINVLTASTRWSIRNRGRAVSHPVTALAVSPEKIDPTIKLT